MMTLSTEIDDDVKLQWVVEKRILLIDMSAAKSTNMLVYDPIIVGFLDSSPHTVDLILHLPTDKTLPPLKRLTNYAYQQHPQLGYVLMVGIELSPIIRFFIASVSKIRNMNMRMFGTIDEATQFLREIRSL